MSETMDERRARTGARGDNETPEEANERIRRTAAAGDPSEPSADGKPQSQYQREHDEWLKKHQDYVNATSTDGHHGVNADGSDAGAKGVTQYVSPGSANVGGYEGGAKDIHDFFRSGEKDNDAAQAGNSAAMGLSVSRMKENRAPIAENEQLVGREAASRQQQLEATDIMGQAARGNAPSAANAQTTMGLNDTMQGQAGAAGAARGLGALGGVQTMGAQGVGMQGTNLAISGGMARSREVNDAMGAYGGLAGDVRSGDLGRVNQTNQNILAGQSINDDWKIGNAGLAAKQGQLGNSMGQVDDQWYGAAMEPGKRQHANDEEIKAIEAGQSLDSAAADRAKAKADSDRNRQIAGGAVQGGLTLIGTAAGGPAGGAGGAVVGGIANTYIRGR